MTAGQLLAYAGMAEGKMVVWLPSYGPEMRGGTAYCTVVISDKPIASPIIENPQAIAVFNRPSMDKFESKVKKGGVLVVNSSLIDIKSNRDDITGIYVPANDIAITAGNAKAANMVILGALIGHLGLVKMETVKAVVAEKMSKKQEFLAMNYQTLEQGFQLGSSPT